MASTGFTQREALLTFQQKDISWMTQQGYELLMTHHSLSSQGMALIIPHFLCVFLERKLDAAVELTVIQFPYPELHQHHPFLGNAELPAHRNMNSVTGYEVNSWTISATSYQHHPQEGSAASHVANDDVCLHKTLNNVLPTIRAAEQVRENQRREIERRQRSEHYRVSSE